MIAELIALHARREPQHVAIKHGDRHLTYRLADEQLRRLQAGLLTARITERKLVGVAHSDPMVETLLLFALEALGVATLPFVQPADAGVVEALRYCDLILCEQPIEGLSLPYALITKEWLGAVVNHPVLPELTLRQKSEGETVNVFTTSGSMGAAKSIVFGAQALDARISSRLRQYRLDRNSRVMAAMPPSASGSYFLAQAVLRVGGTLLYFDEATARTDLVQCTHAMLLPILLHRLAAAFAGQAAEHDARSHVRQRIRIYVVGAKLNSSTRQLAEQALNADVIEAYGTTETGWLAMFNAAGAAGDAGSGEVLPGVDLEVVDKHDQPVPYGETGQIRARSPEMGSGYLDQVLSGKVFRDGWYYTGDFGRMREARQIELIGREDAIMNIGGIKVAPDIVEATLMARAIAADVAVLSRADQSGLEQLYVACVTPRLEGDALDEELLRALGRNLGDIKVVVVDEVPRNAAGKLKRADLRAMIERRLIQSS